MRSSEIRWRKLKLRLRDKRFANHKAPFTDICLKPLQSVLALRGCSATKYRNFISPRLYNTNARGSDASRANNRLWSRTLDRYTDMVSTISGPPSKTTKDGTRNKGHRPSPRKQLKIFHFAGNQTRAADDTAATDKYKCQLYIYEYYLCRFKRHLTLNIGGIPWNRN